MYDEFINLLIFVKVVFFVVLIIKLGMPDFKIDETYDTVENWFDILICLLLLFLFKPWEPKPQKINWHTCVLIFAYALIMLIKLLKKTL